MSVQTPVLEDENDKVKDTFVRRIHPRTVVEKTGRPWEEWNAILDAWDVKTKGFTAGTRYLRERYGVSMWWSNTIVSRYEFIRDLR
jgi:hypothetical protein